MSGTETKEPVGEIVVNEKPAEKPDERKGVNALAIVAICLAWVPIAGLVLGIIAACEAKKGKFKSPLTALAFVALAFGVAFTVLWAIALVIAAVLFGIAVLIKISLIIIFAVFILWLIIGGVPEITIGVDTI